MKNVEFSIVQDVELPPLVISMNEYDVPRVMLNTQ